jgi:hypothetical protein
MRDEHTRRCFLESLVPQLPEPLLAPALQVAQQIGDDYNKSRVLSALAPHLPEALLTNALETARQIQEGQPSARALTDLARHLPESQRRPWLSWAAEKAQQIPVAFRTASPWAAIAPQLPVDQQLALLIQHGNEALPEEPECDEAFASLVPTLSPSATYQFWSSVLGKLSPSFDGSILRLERLATMIHGEEAPSALAHALLVASRWWP